MIPAGTVLAGLPRGAVAHLYTGRRPADGWRLPDAAFCGARSPRERMVQVANQRIASGVRRPCRSCVRLAFHNEPVSADRVVLTDTHPDVTLPDLWRAGWFALTTTQLDRVILLAQILSLRSYYTDRLAVSDETLHATLSRRRAGLAHAELPDWERAELAAAQHSRAVDGVQRELHRQAEERADRRLARAQRHASVFTGHTGVVDPANRPTGT